MRKTLLSTAVALATLPLGASVATAEDLPISANISIVSDYAFRGISQTDQRPALQGGFDYEHDSGFYAGLWASNVSWLSEADASNSLEIDVYAGYAGEIGPFGYDIGLLQYYYPGSYGGAYAGEKPHTLEGYIGLSWKFLSFSYAHSFTNLFGIDNTKGSEYYALGASYEVMEGLTAEAHYGYSYVSGGGTKNYADWKLGLTKSYGGFDLGLHYIDTDDTKGEFAPESWGDERFVLSISKSF